MRFISKSSQLVTTFFLSTLALSTLACSVSANESQISPALLPENGVLACKRLTSDDKRLACYDDLFSAIETPREMPPKIKEATTTVSEASTQTVSPSENELSSSTDSEQAAINSFGAEKLSRKADDSDELDELSAVIASVSEDPRGRRTFYLDNGQVWEESENSRVRAEKGTNILISKGFFSAYYLKRAGTSTRVRVNRIQ